MSVYQMARRSRGRSTNDVAARERDQHDKDLDYQWRNKRRDSKGKEIDIGPGPFTGPDSNLETYIDQALTGSRIRVTDVQAALEYLARLTGDSAFEAAARVLPTYSLGDSGLKAAAQRLLRNTGRTLADFMIPFVDPPPVSQAASAQEVAVMFRLPGISLRTLVDTLRKAPPRAQKNPPQPFPTGDTGRYLLVRWRVPFMDAPDVPLSSMYGIALDEEGWATVPDNRDWRRMIANGFFLFHGEILPPSSDLGKSVPETNPSA